MGNSDSKLVFKQGIFRLSEPTQIAPDDPYWKSFWELPESAEDVFSLFSAVDVRRARDHSLANLETLVKALTSRLFLLRRHRSFPHAELTPAKQALNCVRVLTRILPFIYETDQLEAWEDKTFWAKRRQRVRGGQAGKPDVLFDESNAEKEPKVESVDEIKETQPLGEELIDVLIDLLFFAGFTLPTNDRSKEKVTFAIWEKGVGCTNPPQATKELESNRAEILRLLLTLSSKSLYLPAHILPVKGVKALTYMATCPDKQLVLSMLCSQLNTTINYSPTNWRVPYDHVLYKDSKQILVTYSLQFLLSLLLYPILEDGKKTAPKNYFRHFLGRIHRLQDLEFIVEGLKKSLNQPLQASSSYLPGSQKSLDWAPETIMLFWETLQCNKRFRSFVIDSDSGHDFMILMLFYALEYRLDLARQGLVRMCVFVLQTLSTEPNFGKRLNKPFVGNDSLPASLKLEKFGGTYADFLIISIHTLITKSKGKIDAIYPSLLATINNIAPYLESLGATSNSHIRLLQLFQTMSSPSFLLANETNYALLQSLLESINAIIEHQYPNNPAFVKAVFRCRKPFHSLRTFTLENGQQEIARLAEQQKAAAAAGSTGVTSPPRVARDTGVDSIRSPSSVRSPTLGNVPEETTFAIGDDDDTDTEAQTTEPPTPSYSSPTHQISRNASFSSSTAADDPLPTQVRGMSEKARGKMPAGQLSFSRQSSTTSLVNGPATPGGGSGFAAPTAGFDPTRHWVDTWLPSLPLHTVLTLIDSPEPPVALPNTIDASPPRIHLFEWTALSMGWYESLLWGFVFASEMVVQQKGTVGVWNGTSVRLFRVERDSGANGPSLMKPMGAVDAVGTRLVSGVRNLGSGAAAMMVSSGAGGGGSEQARTTLPDRGVRDV